MVMFEFLGYASVMLNIALVGVMFMQSDQGETLLEEWTQSEKVMLLVAIEHVLIFAKVLLAGFIPDVPTDVLFLLRAQAAKEQELHNKAFELQAKMKTRFLSDKAAGSNTDSTVSTLVGGSLQGDAASQTTLLEWVKQEHHGRFHAEHDKRTLRREILELQSKKAAKASSLQDLGSVAIISNLALAFAMMAYVLANSQ